MADNQTTVWCFLLPLLLLATPAWAYRTVTVTDGDSVILGATGMATGLRLRLEGLDTPEMNGRCPEERALAQEARDRLIALTRGGVTVESGLVFDRYGRILVRLRNREGQDVAQAMLTARSETTGQPLARAYNGTGPRGSWCPPASRGR